jgi:hypothetical protein
MNAILIKNIFKYSKHRLICQKNIFYTLFFPFSIPGNLFYYSSYTQI